MKILIVFVILSLFSCKKQKTFDFPIGNYKMFAYTFKRNMFSENYFLTFSNFNSNNLVYNIEYKGKNKLIYTANGKQEIFTILNIDINSDTSHFQFENSKYYGNTNYRINLRNKKGKKFLFEYCLVNDSTIIGEFWEKGQDYHSFDAPNMSKIEFIKINPSIKGEIDALYNSEILGVFKKL